MSKDLPQLHVERLEAFHIKHFFKRLARASSPTAAVALCVVGMAVTLVAG